MSTALALARRGLGTTSPNPTVGCVIVKDGKVIGRGWTAPGGRPHAETVALDRAGERAAGATAYVTLEPCSHHGATPPCANALVAARLARVVYAVEDPDPRVRGGGARHLRAGGIETSGGVMEAEAREINAGFFSRIQSERPLVTLKIALSLDGAIALASGKSRWISGEAARAAAHALRAQHDAVLIGAGTLRSDDPLLTVRLPGLPLRPPVRVVMLGAQPLDPRRKLIKSAADTPLWVMGRGKPRSAAFEWIRTPTRRGQSDPKQVLQLLARRGVTRVLIEGGGAIAASFLGKALVDRLVLFRAGLTLGGDAIAGIGRLSLLRLPAAPRWQRVDVRPVGSDLMETYTAVQVL
jgi:diaminohydroxyphosphoribosylaminopyrimidine deaminase/5-amino-6-(5-phosphoribosylamino)uracil reductase